MISKLNKFIILSFVFFFWLFQYNSFALSFNKLLKESVIKFFSTDTINKTYFDNFQYEGAKIASNFISNKNKINNTVLLTRNNNIILTKKEFIKNNKTKIFNTILYNLSILNKNNNYNKNIAKTIIAIKWNVNILNWTWNNIMTNYYQVLENEMWWKNVFLYNKNITLEQKIQKFYSNLYQISLYENIIWNYILYKNKDNSNFNTIKDNILIYFNWQYIYKTQWNKNLIKNILYKYDVDNNTNYIKYLNLFNNLNK